MDNLIVGGVVEDPGNLLSDFGRTAGVFRPHTGPGRVPITPKGTRTPVFRMRT